MKRGDIFLHSRWLDPETGKPLRCIVTTVRSGAVYYRALSGGAVYYFVIESANRYVMRVVGKEDEKHAQTGN